VNRILQNNTELAVKLHVFIFSFVLGIVSIVRAAPELQITAERSGETSYQVHITNVSTNDVVFQIGSNIGNGTRFEYDAISLRFTDGDGDVQPVRHNRGVMFGRVDPLYMALPPRTILSFTVDPKRWRFDDLKRIKLNGKPFNPVSFRVLLTISELREDRPIQFASDDAHLLSGSFESPEYRIRSQQGAQSNPQSHAP
jgi:hypothetical protein